jgi:DNA-binding CsgD family transcriptional regulator
MRQVAAAVRRSSAPEAPGKADVLLEGMAALYTDGYAAAVPLLRRAVVAFGTEELTLDEGFRGAWVAVVAAVDLWDDAHWDVVSRRHLDVVRTSGALSLLPLALATRATFHIHAGDLAAAASLVGEGRWVAEVTGGENTGPAIPEAWLAAMRGDESTAAPLIQATLDEAAPQGEGTSMNMMWAARAVLCNGLGRYEEALEAARQAAGEGLGPGPKWALVELVEAAVRCGRMDLAAEAFERLSAMTRASGTDWARGTQAATGALLRDDTAADDLHREAIHCLGRTRIRVETARAQLRYGEWLRRQGRRVDARVQLRAAHTALTVMGVEAFAERARRELLATGETVRKRTVETRGELTAQEAHIARLATEGLTNPEIAAQLYLSPRTVEWHLRKVFTKLGVTTRRQLRRTLQDA